MVHNVLEEIDFEEVGRAVTPDDLCRPGSHARQCLDRMIQPNLGQLHTRTPIDKLEEAARRQIAQLIWNALKTPLVALGGPLFEVPKANRLHEVEFLFPEQTAPGVGMRRAEEGFVTGFMDLLFRKDGRYFLLDWKTNSCPPMERNKSVTVWRNRITIVNFGSTHATARLAAACTAWTSFLERFGGVYYPTCGA